MTRTTVCLKAFFVPWARGHLSHLDDDLITFCWRNACNDFLTLVFVHERQGDVITALFSTLGFFSHSSSCWLWKTKSITLLDDNQNSILSCCSNFINGITLVLIRLTCTQSWTVTHFLLFLDATGSLKLKFIVSCCSVAHSLLYTLTGFKSSPDVTVPTFLCLWFVW